MSRVRDPVRYIQSQQPKVIRITTNEGVRMRMIGARFSEGADTIMGFVEHPAGVLGEFTEIPWSAVGTVEAEQYAHGLTVVAIAGGVLGWAALTAIVIHQVTAVKN